MPPEDDDKDLSAEERFRRRVEGIEGGEEDDTDDDDNDRPEESVEVDETDSDPVVRPTRAEKKRERLRLRDELEETRRKNNELAERIARMEGAQSAMHRQAAVRDETDDEDELDSVLESYQSELESAWNALRAKGANATEQDKEAYRLKAKEIDKKKAIATADIIVKRRMGEVTEAQSQEAVRAAIRTRYSDVYSNPRAVQYAEGEYRKLVALGERGTPEQVLDKAMEAARTAFRMRSAPPPTERDRRQFSGPPRGRAPSTGGGDDSGGEIRMTKDLRRMARAMYPNLSEAESYKKWAQGPGKAYLRGLKDK